MCRNEGFCILKVPSDNSPGIQSRPNDRPTWTASSRGTGIKESIPTSATLGYVRVRELSVTPERAGSSPTEKRSGVARSIPNRKIVPPEGR